MTNLKRSKVLSLMIVFVMLFTTVMPNVSWAAGTKIEESSDAEGKLEGKKASEIEGSNVLIVGKYAFDLDDKNYTLDNYLTAAKTVYNNGESNEIYYKLGDKWYNLVAAEGKGLVKAVEVKAENINGNGLYTYMNMEYEEEAEELTVESVSAVNGTVTVTFEEYVEELPKDLVFTIDGEEVALTEENAEVVEGKLEITVDEIEAPEEGVTEVTYAVTLGEVTKEATLKVAAMGELEPATETVAYEVVNEVIEISNEDVKYEDGNFLVSTDVTEFTFKDGDLEVTATKDEDEWTFTTDIGEIEPGQPTDEESREEFNKKAKEITEIKYSEGNKLADIDYNKEDYTATVTVETLDISSIPGSGTGIFNTLKDLGVKQVKFTEDEWIDVKSENVDKIIAGFQNAEEGDNKVTISYSAKIKMEGYVEFEQDFTVIFKLSDDKIAEKEDEAEHTIAAENVKKNRIFIR